MNPSNHITVIGNVGQAPENRAKTREGQLVVSFAVAQNTSGIDPETGNRVRKEPQWLRVSCFASLAERVQANLKKGDLVLVAGELKAQTYVDKNGAKRLSFEISAGDVLRVERLRSAKVASQADGVGSDIPSFDEWQAEEAQG